MLIGIDEKKKRIDCHNMTTMALSQSLNNLIKNRETTTTACAVLTIPINFERFGRRYSFSNATIDIGFKLYKEIRPSAVSLSSV